ncbi:MAG: ATP-binding cassette domain-containing protein [Leptospirales bacterium]|nr:ATP-binding cassette domain-containing protein [Leptospirales bacterium]
MINVKDLSISFADSVIINDVSFNVKRGETLVVMGKNGSGKSVLLKSLSGLIDGYKGDIEIDGIDINKLFSQRGKSSKQGDQTCVVSYVFQKGGLFDSINIFDNTAFGLRRMGIIEDEVSQRVLSTIERVGLKGSEEKLPSELSGGMQKRAGLARAVCMNPTVILYDDPTAGLDPILTDSITDLIIEIKHSLNSASVVATNDLKVAKKIADKIALLYSGRFVSYMESNEFFNESDPYAKQFIRGELEGPIDVL